MLLAVVGYDFQPQIDLVLVITSVLIGRKGRGYQIFFVPSSASFEIVCAIILEFLF